MLQLHFYHLVAQAYGQGVYGSSTYGNGVIQIGPIRLPASGANLAFLVFALIASVGIGIFVWQRGRRKYQKSLTTTQN